MTLVFTYIDALTHVSKWGMDFFRLPPLKIIRLLRLTEMKEKRPESRGES